MSQSLQIVFAPVAGPGSCSTLPVNLQWFSRRPSGKPRSAQLAAAGHGKVLLGDVHTNYQRLCHCLLLFTLTIAYPLDLLPEGPLQPGMRGRASPFSPFSLAGAWGGDSSLFRLHALGHGAAILHASPAVFSLFTPNATFLARGSAPIFGSNFSVQGLPRASPLANPMIPGPPVHRHSSLGGWSGCCCHWWN